MEKSSRPKMNNEHSVIYLSLCCFLEGDNVVRIVENEACMASCFTSINIIYLLCFHLCLLVFISVVSLPSLTGKCDHR